MMWTDIAALLLIVGIAWAESQRGFGRSIFDFVGAVIILKIADLLADPVAKAVPLLAEPSGNQAFWFAALFLVLAALVILGTKVIYDTTLLSLDVLDPVVGAILGIASGMIVAYVLLRTLMIGYGAGPDADMLASSLMGQELLKLRTYHTVVNALQNLGNW
jgi:uncharacterized membrane protein required for colicin V production